MPSKKNQALSSLHKFVSEKLIKSKNRKMEVYERIKNKIIEASENDGDLPGTYELAEDMGLSTRMVQAYIRELKSEDLVVTKKRGDGTVVHVPTEFLS